jgi:hypothetical protein
MDVGNAVCIFHALKEMWARERECVRALEGWGMGDAGCEGWEYGKKRILHIGVKHWRI